MTTPAPTTTEIRPGLLVSAAAFCIVVAGLRAAQDILLPFLVAAFVAMILAPIMQRLRERGVPSWLAIGLIVLMVLGVFAGFGSVIGASINGFTQELPAYQNRIQEQTAGLVEWLSSAGVVAWLSSVGVDTSALNEIPNLVDPGQAMSLVAALFAGLGNVLTNSFLIFLTVIFALIEASSLGAKLEIAFGDASRNIDRLHQVVTSVNRYLLIKTVISLGTGVAAGLLCALLGVDFPLLWGLLAFLLNFIPNVGSAIACIPPALLALVQFGPVKALILVAGYMIINNVLGNVVETHYMGQGLGLSTLVVFVALIFWGWVFGAVGMLLSVPLTMCAKIALETSESTKWMAILLGSAPPAGLAAAAGPVPAEGETATESEA